MILYLRRRLPVHRRAVADTPIERHRDASATARVIISSGRRHGDGNKPSGLPAATANWPSRWSRSVVRVDWTGTAPAAYQVAPRSSAPAPAQNVSVVREPLMLDIRDGYAIVVYSVSGRARFKALAPSPTVNSVSGSIALAGHAETGNLHPVSADILAPTRGSEVKRQAIYGPSRPTAGLGASSRSAKFPAKCS